MMQKRDAQFVGLPFAAVLMQDVAIDVPEVGGYDLRVVVVVVVGEFERVYVCGDMWIEIDT